jgi:hypothetical protein
MMPDAPSPGARELPVAAIALARAWAGEGLRSLIVSGSHASGEAVWVECGGRVSLSDLDLYAVMRDAASARGGEARARAARSGLAERLLARGLAAPLEVAFLTLDDIARLPARPGTLALARHGVTVEGDEGWRARVPAWRVSDIDTEETLLLLENRAFELLIARDLLEGTALARLQARHATLKVALDLAWVASLAAGEDQGGTTARVAWARAHGVHAGAEPPWDEALAWRAGDTRLPDPAVARGEWQRTAAAWVAAWCALMRIEGAGDPFEVVHRASRRASARRRLGRALRFHARGGQGPSLASRLAFAAAGTPQHRLNAAAGTLLVHATARGGEEPAAWDTRALRTLASLGMPAGSTEAAAREIVRRWDVWILDGQRTAGPA